MCAQVNKKESFDHLLKVFITRLGLEGSNEKVFLVMFLYCGTCSYKIFSNTFYLY